MESQKKGVVAWANPMMRQRKQAMTAAKMRQLIVRLSTIIKLHSYGCLYPQRMGSDCWLKPVAGYEMGYELSLIGHWCILQRTIR